MLNYERLEHVYRYKIKVFKYTLHLMFDFRKNGFKNILYFKLLKNKAKA